MVSANRSWAIQKYFHDGVDIQGESSVDMEWVRAPIGGIVTEHGGSADMVSVNLEVLLVVERYTFNSTTCRILIRT